MVKTESKHKTFSIKSKMYIFIVVTILTASIGTAFLAYKISADQINNSYKKITSDTARIFASSVDSEYLKELRATAESEEYQKLREQAEEDDDEAVIQNYLEEKGLWDKYSDIRSNLRQYIDTMKSIKYLYIVACGDIDSDRDMYLIDGDDVGIYETGYYEIREVDLRGADFSQEVEPTISNGDWGWLCSAYTPVHDADGNVVAQVGCDFDMEDVMRERQMSLLYIISVAIVLTVIVLVLAIHLINRMLISPLDKLTVEIKNFKPLVHAGYDESGVMNLDIDSDDEIGVLYNGIRSMEMNIVDYLDNLDVLEKDNKNKDEQIGQISKDAYKDSLTGVGNKTAYIQKASEINGQIKTDNIDFAIIMADLNNLKQINDEYGHKTGDVYIRGCCKMICDTCKHSPVYRVGGDEFVALLLGEDYDNRKSIFKALRESFELRYNRRDLDPWLRFSASIGMAERSSRDNTIEFVCNRADEAMYENKKIFQEKHGAYRSAQHSTENI